jgi:hypothetical protein
MVDLSHLLNESPYIQVVNWFVSQQSQNILCHRGMLCEYELMRCKDNNTV